MSFRELQRLPGGALAVLLLWLGGATFLISAIMVALAGSSAVSAEFGSMSWLVPAWGGLAVGLAVALRKSDSRTLFGISLATAIIGGTGLLLAACGIQVTVG